MILASGPLSLSVDLGGGGVKAKSSFTQMIREKGSGRIDAPVDPRERLEESIIKRSLSLNWRCPWSTIHHNFSCSWIKNLLGLEKFLGSPMYRGSLRFGRIRKIRFQVLPYLFVRSHLTLEIRLIVRTLNLSYE